MSVVAFSVKAFRTAPVRLSRRKKLSTVSGSRIRPAGDPRLEPTPRRVTVGEDNLEDVLLVIGISIKPWAARQLVRLAAIPNPALAFALVFDHLKTFAAPNYKWRLARVARIRLPDVEFAADFL